MKLFETISIGLIVLAPVIFIVLHYVTAPYGKHSKSGWGLLISSKWAWILMETPAFIIVFSYLIYLNRSTSFTLLLFFAFWLMHYGYRSFIYPMRISKAKKNFPILVMLMAIVFNLLNGYVQGENLISNTSYSQFSFLSNWNALVGAGMFIIGFIIHVHSDHLILTQKNRAEGDYIIPKGGLFDKLSNPNYFGEIIQWLGWAILLGSLAGWAFFIFAFANLWPRAIANHKWYKSKFPDYPIERKIIIPFIY